MNAMKDLKDGDVKCGVQCTARRCETGERRGVD